MPGAVIESHAKIEAECGKCHVRFRPSAQPRLCLNCHQEIRADIQRGAGYHGKITEEQCRRCHTDHEGRKARIVVLDEKKFDHRRTDFLLRGAHHEKACKGCHPPGKKHREAPSACSGCHRANDKHLGGLGSQCESCHIEDNWNVASFDHDRTGFPLKHRHRLTGCADCHLDERYAGTARDCLSCHGEDDAHRGHNGPRCESCHTEEDWKSITFRHDLGTAFPLLGRHREAACTECHRTPIYLEKLPGQCESCHRQGDVHQGAFGENCARCHTEQDWKSTTFRHDLGTDYPLLGRHRQAACTACHRNPVYQDKLPRRCVACHGQDDAHKGVLGDTCARCHNPQEWKGARFDHDVNTRFPLLDKHRIVKCESCHESPGLRELPPLNCVGCHLMDDRESHQGRYGWRCETCHVEGGWRTIIFEHGLDARFPRAGKHRAVDCGACHKDSPFQLKAEDRCYACHKRDDIHFGSFEQQCDRCHLADDWRKIRREAIEKYCRDGDAPVPRQRTEEPLNLLFWIPLCADAYPSAGEAAPQRPGLPGVEKRP